MRELSSITEAEANELGKELETLASEDGGKPVSYAILDVSGDPILAYRMDGASADSFWIALNKADAALRSRRDTVEIAHVFDEESEEWRRKAAHEHRADDNRRTANPSFVSWAGGVVLRVDDEIVGSLAVSGRDELDDHELAGTVRVDFTIRHVDPLDFSKGPPNAS